MQEAVQTQTVCIEGIRRKLTSYFTKFLFDFFRNANIKNAFHQRLNRKKVRIDVLHVSHGLLESVRGLVTTTNWSGMHLSVASTRTMLLLQILEHAARESAERLKCCPTEFLLLTKRGILANQPVVLPVKALTVRTLAGLFWHLEPEAREPS